MELSTASLLDAEHARPKPHHELPLKGAKRPAFTRLALFAY